MKKQVDFDLINIDTINQITNRLHQEKECYKNLPSNWDYSQTSNLIENFELFFKLLTTNKKFAFATHKELQKRSINNSEYLKEKYLELCDSIHNLEDIVYEDVDEDEVFDETISPYYTELDNARQELIDFIKDNKISDETLDKWEYNK